MEQDNKRMCASHFASIRNMVDSVNRMGIQKEDIVDIITNEEGLFLIYYI